MNVEDLIEILEEYPKNTKVVSYMPTTGGYSNRVIVSELHVKFVGDGEFEEVENGTLVLEIG